MQRHIVEAIESGYATVGGAPVYSHLYFDGLRILLRGLSRARAPIRRVMIEHAGARDRLARLREATELLERWPERFLERCAAIRKPYTVFAHDVERIPWWLDTVLRRSLLQVRARLSVAEAEAIVRAARKATGSTALIDAREYSGRDVGAVLRPVPIARQTVSRLLGNLDFEIASATGMRRRLLQRDKVAFTIARRFGLQVSKVVLLKAEPLVRDCLLDPEMMTYLRDVRPYLAARNSDAPLFVGANGGTLTANAVRARFRRAVCAARLLDEIAGWRAWIAVDPAAEGKGGPAA